MNTSLVIVVAILLIVVVVVAVIVMRRRKRPVHERISNLPLSADDKKDLANIATPLPDEHQHGVVDALEQLTPAEQGVAMNAIRTVPPVSRSQVLSLVGKMSPTDQVAIRDAVRSLNSTELTALVSAISSVTLQQASAALSTANNLSPATLSNVATLFGNINASEKALIVSFLGQLQLPDNSPPLYSIYNPGIALPATPTTEILQPGYYLGVSSAYEPKLVSSSGNTTLQLTSDGNLRLYDLDTEYSTVQAGIAPLEYAVMDKTGEFYLVTQAGQKLTSGTNVPGSTLNLSTDGNLYVISPQNVKLWSTKPGGTNPIGNQIFFVAVPGT